MTERPHDPFSVRPLAPATLDDLVPTAASIVAVGESAHFVTEFHHLRAELVADLVHRHGVTTLALEVGHDEVPLIASWWRDSDPGTPCPVGPLTAALYGTFLAELRTRLGATAPPVILGVDLPNSLTLSPTLDPLADLLAHLDPAATNLVSRARALAGPVRGASAAASATAWSELEPAARHELLALLARLSARSDALASAGAAGVTAEQWRHAVELTCTATTTALMLGAMTELFAGTGLPGDTTLRERFVAQRLLDAAARLPDGERIAYVAHNNHIQKSAVVFDGELVAYPAGHLVARALGDAYVSLGLSHVDDEVPEMIVPAGTPLGFGVERVAAAPLTDDAVESAAAGVAPNAPVVVCPAADGFTIRSQSAVTRVPADAFDAVVVVAAARTDRTAP